MYLCTYQIQRHKRFTFFNGNRPFYVYALPNLQHYWKFRIRELGTKHNQSIREILTNHTFFMKLHYFWNFQLFFPGIVTIILYLLCTPLWYAIWTTYHKYLMLYKKCLWINNNCAGRRPATQKQASYLAQRLVLECVWC